MFTHLDPQGQPGMVDVSGKDETVRTAHARSLVILPEVALAALEDGDIETHKGPVFRTAILAGVMAAKRTSELIPLCHTIPLDSCQVEIAVNDSGEVVVDCRVKATHKTGVEMEALTGASVAALTIYDMCKAFGHGIAIRETRLVEKTGGKQDYHAGA